eukprot:gene23728-32110_t
MFLKLGKLLVLMVLITSAHSGNTGGKAGIYYRWNSTLTSYDVLPFINLNLSAPVLQDGFYSNYYPISSDNPFIDESQGQSPVLRDIFEDMINGFYIDLAANDWRIGSNTVTLERYFNWTGICIEPNQQYLRGLLENRRCTVFTNPVYSEDNVMVKFYLKSGLGGIVSEDMDNANAKDSIIELPTITLNNILDFLNIHEIDYLSLDVEGGEYKVLSNFDFNKTTIKVLTVERPKEILHMLLIKHGYWWLTQISQKNRYFGEFFYIHYSVSRFHELMNKYRPTAIVKYSVNYRDHFSTFLKRPSWPLEPGVKLETNELLRNEDLIKCGSAKEVYLMRSNRLHLIFNVDVFMQMGREFSEVTELSPRLCTTYSRGRKVDLSSVKLPVNDSYWAEE